MVDPFVWQLRWLETFQLDMSLLPLLTEYLQGYHFCVVQKHLVSPDSLVASALLDLLLMPDDP